MAGVVRADVDIRADGRLVEGETNAGYIVALDDCSDLVSLELNATQDPVRGPGDTLRLSESSAGCFA
ncbi:MAG: hypothetical protein MJE66_21640, partial [Proteobacteria bacterium]|nr:hypothetical protein [Pseudomonadota bacterium]